MTVRTGRNVAAVILALAAALFPPGARADDTAITLNGSIVGPANDAIKAALRAHETTAQARPIGEQERPLSNPGLPTGFTYTLDVSVAKSEGNTGFRNGLPGGMDAVLGYGFSKNFRFQAAYYEFQEYPLGFDTGTVPVYLQGLAAPIATQNLANPPTDVTIKNHIAIYQAQNLFTIAHKLPIVITPTYFQRTGSVGGHSDAQLLEINGFPQVVRLRTVEYELIAATLPFLSTPKMFGTFTAAPQWNVNLNGANTVNHMQIFELLYLEYRPTNHLTFFLQPSRLINYLPPDPYPEHINTFLYGASYKFTKNTFMQLLASTGTPSNVSTLGIQSLTCQMLPCAPNQVAPAITGLKATDIQLQFGIGSPSVIPL
jgi:hypothetical protein